MLLELGTDSKRLIWLNSVLLVRLLFFKQHSLDTNHSVSKALGSKVTEKLITILRP